MVLFVHVISVLTDLAPHIVVFITSGSTHSFIMLVYIFLRYEHYRLQL